MRWLLLYHIQLAGTVSGRSHLGICIKYISHNHKLVYIISKKKKKKKKQLRARLTQIITLISPDMQKKYDEERERNYRLTG